MQTKHGTEVEYFVASQTGRVVACFPERDRELMVNFVSKGAAKGVNYAVFKRTTNTARITL